MWSFSNKNRENPQDVLVADPPIGAELRKRILDLKILGFVPGL